MLHIFHCKKCNAEIRAYCFEKRNYTEKGKEQRRRQLDAMLCEDCFGETPERAPEQTPVPCFNSPTGTITTPPAETKKVH